MMDLALSHIPPKVTSLSGVDVLIETNLEQSGCDLSWRDSKVKHVYQTWQTSVLPDRSIIYPHTNTGITMIIFKLQNSTITLE